MLTKKTVIAVSILGAVASVAKVVMSLSLFLLLLCFVLETLNHEFAGVTVSSCDFFYALNLGS